MDKQFRLDASEIEPLVPGMGACFASDRILVDGAPVGYMYREEPDSSDDSGWRFLAGDESEEYMEDVDKFGMYDVNTVANYDRSILPFLLASAGSAYVRDPESGRLVPA